MTSALDADLASLTDVNTPWAIRVGVTLGLPDAVGSEPVSVTELADRVGADAGALTRLLRFLACRGVFTETAPEMFAHTPNSQLLRRDDPSCWNEWLDLRGIAHRMDRAATEGLMESVRTGQPSYPGIFGRPMWTDVAEDPALAESFDLLMRSQNHRWVPGVLEYDWSDVRRVVDVGGGAGGLLVELLTEWPKLAGTLVDLGTNVSAANEFFTEQGITDRASAVVGNFFDPLPDGGDVYLLAHVLHDWDDEHAERILRRCAEAAGPGGRVLVAERAVDATHNSRETGIKDLRMLTLFAGRERDLGSFRRLAGNAGLTERMARPIQAGHYLLEYTP
jgi:2,7-dihydroxy-5-methyl-1-naphthoate 7-O-methyltransferase